VAPQAPGKLEYLLDSRRLPASGEDSAQRRMKGLLISYQNYANRLKGSEGRRSGAMLIWRSETKGRNLRNQAVIQEIEARDAISPVAPGSERRLLWKLESTTPKLHQRLLKQCWRWKHTFTEAGLNPRCSIFSGCGHRRLTAAPFASICTARMRVPRVKLSSGSYELDAWRETPFYTERERAALAWTEAVTLISEGHVPDSVYEEARRHFSEKELVDLTMAVVSINGWNRLAISFRAVPGTYQPVSRHRTAGAPSAT
jgi:hypothetical protein